MPDVDAMDKCFAKKPGTNGVDGEIKVLVCACVCVSVCTYKYLGCTAVFLSKVVC